MTLLFRALALVGLLLVIVPPIVFYGDPASSDTLKQLMLVGTVVWFVFSYLGFRQNPKSSAKVG